MRDGTSYGTLAMAAMGLLLALVVASIILAPCVAAEAATEAVAGGFDGWAWFMQYGPMLLQICLLVALMFNVWQRNVWRSVVCAGACIVTFVLGW